MIHFAKLEKSPRLRRLLAYLIERGPEGATTREITLNAEIMAVGTSISELRANGCLINCHFQGRTIEGSSVFRYVLISFEHISEGAKSIDFIKPFFTERAYPTNINTLPNHPFASKNFICPFFYSTTSNSQKSSNNKSFNNTSNLEF